MAGMGSGMGKTVRSSRAHSEEKTVIEAESAQGGCLYCRTVLSLYLEQHVSTLFKERTVSVYLLPTKTTYSCDPGP